MSCSYMLYHAMHVFECFVKGHKELISAHDKKEAEMVCVRKFHEHPRMLHKIKEIEYVRLHIH